MQISAKAIQSSGTALAVDFAGRKSTQAYRMAKAAKELKRDMEYMLTRNVAAVVGNNTTPGTGGQPTGDTRKTGSLGAWVGGNSLHGGGSPAGAACDGDGNDITIDAGTPRIISLTLIRQLIQKLFVAGSDADTIMVGPFNKESISYTMIYKVNQSIILKIQIFSMSLNSSIRPSQIKENLETHLFGSEVLVFNEVESTNQLAKLHLKEGEGLVVIADGQTKGKGLTGRRICWLVRWKTTRY